MKSSSWKSSSLRVTVSLAPRQAVAGHGKIRGGKASLPRPILALAHPVRSRKNNTVRGSRPIAVLVRAGNRVVPQVARAVGLRVVTLPEIEDNPAF